MRSGLLNQFQQDFFVCYSRFQEFCQIQLFFNPKRIWRYYIRLIPSLFLCTLVAELEQMPKWLPINLKVSLIDKFYIFNSWQIIHRQDLLWGLKKIIIIVLVALLTQIYASLRFLFLVLIYTRYFQECTKNMNSDL